MFLLLATLGIHAASAQDDFVVTRKGDTIYGRLNIMSYELVDRVQVSGDKKKKQTMQATEIHFMKMDSTMFVPMRHNNSIRMMKVIRSGFLSYYAFRLPDQVTYDGRLLVKLGSPGQEVPNLGFKRIMTEYLADCGPLVEEIKKGDISRREIERIVDRYNECIKPVAPAATEPALVVTVQPSDAVTTALDLLQQRIEVSSLPGRSDALAMLNDIRKKTLLGEAVPSYLKEGLKSAVSADDQIKAEVEKMIGLLPK